MLRCETACGSGEINKGSALVIRYEGPRGSPGMPEMLSPGAALIGMLHTEQLAVLLVQTWCPSGLTPPAG